MQLEAHHGRAEEAEEVQVRHRPDGRRPEAALRGLQEARCRKSWASPSRTIRRSSSGAPSARCSRAGRAAGPSPIARSKASPSEWGTACNVQSMVFGNMGDTSATGVAFSRNPATGENKFYGEWLVNAQGEDVVAGIRTPNPLNEATKNEQNKHLASLETEMPGAVQAARRHPHASSSSTTTTCRTSSSRSRKASSTCSSAATASGPARRP